MNPRLEIQVIAVIVAVACALPGVFLVLRRVALMSDAISHSVLLGIALGFFVTRSTTNPLVVMAAAASGVLTVWLVEMLLKTRRVKEDAAIGLVFPVLFSIGVVLISRHARDVHLDIDAVLLGELAFAPLNRLTLFGLDWPRGVWVMGGILLLNIAVIVAFYKELELATFDPALAAALGFAPAAIHYGLMAIVSVTAVGAFDHVGSILVVALMIAPPAAAYLLTDRLSRMLILSVVIGVVSALGGYWVARLFDVSIAGSMATMTGVTFLLALIFAPERGLVAQQLNQAERKRRFALEMLLVHLSRHEGTESEEEENNIEHITNTIDWHAEPVRETVRRAVDQRLVRRENGRLQLTEAGRLAAQTVLSR